MVEFSYIVLVHRIALHEFPQAPYFMRVQEVRLLQPSPAPVTGPPSLSTRICGRALRTFRADCPIYLDPCRGQAFRNAVCPVVFRFLPKHSRTLKLYEPNTPHLFIGNIILGGNYFFSEFQVTSPAVLRSQEGGINQESSSAGTAVVPSSSFDYCAIM